VATARRRVQLGLLLSGPLGWLVVAYLGSLTVLFISAFWQLDDFSGEIVKQPTFANFRLLWENDVYEAAAEQFSEAELGALVFLAMTINAWTRLGFATGRTP